MNFMGKKIFLKISKSENQDILKGGILSHLKIPPVFPEFIDFDRLKIIVVANIWWILFTIVQAS